MSAGKKPSAQSDSKAAAAVEPLSFPSNFMSGVGSSNVPLKSNNLASKHSLSANFFPVIFGKVTSIYQYRLESIIKVKSAKSAKPDPHTPRYPKRAPLPRGQKASTLKQKKDKEQQDQVYLDKFKASAHGAGDPGNGSAEDVELPKRMRRRLIFLLIEHMKADGVNVGIASDYATSLFTVERIQHKNVPGVWRVFYYDEDEDGDSPELRRYDVVVGGARTTDVKALLAAKEGAACAQPNNNSKKNALAALTTLPELLNPFFSHCPNSYTRRDRGLVPTVAYIGANKFYKLDDFRPVGNKEPWTLKTPATPDSPGGVVAMPGFFRSVRASLGSDMLLNINTTTSAFYEANNLMLVLKEFGLGNPLISIHNFIKGLRVRTTYMRQSASAKKTAIKLYGEGGRTQEHIYTLQGLPFLLPKPSADSVFFEYYDKKSDAKEISVRDYWKREDGHRIQLSSDELIVDCGRGGYIPARFLEVLPGQQYKPKTPMVAHACRRPHDNYRMIMEGGMSLFGIRNDNPFAPARNFAGLTVKQNMVRVPVVQLAAGKLLYRNKVQPAGGIASGRWNLKGCKASSPVKAVGSKYVVIELVRPDGPRLSATRFTQFSRYLKEALDNFGLMGFSPHDSTPEQRYQQLNSHRKQTRDELPLSEMFTGMKKQKIAFVVVLLPDNDAELYGQIKRASDVSVGLHTICHVMGLNYERFATKSGGKSQQKTRGPKEDIGTLSGLVMKINLKLSRSSANQVLPQPFTDKLLTTRTMIVGIDVTHPTSEAVPGSPSVAAVVSSIDVNFAQWPASLRANPRPMFDSGQSSERVFELANMMEERLRDFQKVRGHLPGRLLVYRDGLSTDQFDMCTQFELPQIKAAVSIVYGNAKHPPIILVCSVKRHNARIFPLDGSQTRHEMLDHNYNPRPGVAFFEKITYGNNKDFFLVSHETLQGTTRPCHYVVLHNELDDTSITDVANAVSTQAPTNDNILILVSRHTTSASSSAVPLGRCRWYLPRTMPTLRQTVHASMFGTGTCRRNRGSLMRLLSTTRCGSTRM